MKKIELLAPAGSLDSLYAAVQAGANAVYLGGNKFSARAYASNFDNENMKKAVEYCHLYEVKMYVTINTLMKEKELGEALEYAKFLYSVGVDALLVQDTALAVLIKEILPQFELHASTQMTVHNGEAALLLKDKGFQRIVLSRELSLDEIKYISKDLNIETEIFVHGALCVCYSGQCLMSSLIGGRSGNRGRCAQPCRLPYTIIDISNGREKKGYLLSPKDICTIENIRDIIESGTTSLKIEGRMKRPEYVAAVVSSYRKAIDQIINENDINLNKVNINKEKKKLLQLFNREGFSKAYLFGNTGKDMMSYTFPKNTGVILGKVQKDLSILLEEDLSIKDGIRNGEKGFVVSKIMEEGNEVLEASAGSRVKLKPAEFKSGDVLYKTSDIKLLQSMENIYKNPFGKKIDLSLEVNFKVNEPIKLSTTYKGKEYFVKGELVQKALNKPIDRNKLQEYLKKSGNTPFKFSNIKFQDFQDGFMPVSAINESRRAIIEDIENDSIKVNRNNIVNGLKESKKIFNEIPEYIFCVNKLEQMEAVYENGFLDVVVDIFARKSNIKEEMIKENNVWLKVPNIIKSEFKGVCSKIEELLPYIKGIVTSNLGILHKFKGKTTIIGDYKLNIFNSISMDFYSEFLDSVCMSVELNRNEILALAKKSKVPHQVMVYGKVENMVSEYCVIGSTFGEKSGVRSCNKACEKGEFYLKDRIGAEFSVHTDKFCRCYIYNSVPTNLIDNINELGNANINNYRIDFIDEDYNEVSKILKCLKQKKWNGNFNGFTRGHYKRGVE